MKRRPTLSQGPEAPANSHATEEDDISSFKDPSIPTSEYQVERNLDFSRDARDHFSISIGRLHRRLEFLESPMFVDTFVQKPRNQNGILGHRPSPAMSWRRLLDELPLTQENRDDTGAGDGISKASVESSESALFVNSPKSSQITTDQKQKKGISNLDGADSRPVSESPEPNLNGQGKLQFREPVKLKKKISHRQRPTLQKTKSFASGVASSETTRFTTRPIHNSMSRSVSLPVVPRISSFAGSSDRNGQYEDLPTSEKAFFHDLYRKLHWLQFELSAGFREADENTADLLFNVHGGAINPNSRVPESVRIRALAGDPNPRSRSHTLDEKPRIPVPKIELWRIDVNRSRRNQQAGTVVELPKRPLRRPVSFEAIDIDDGKIDTAAWILRRPPSGVPRSADEARPTPHTRLQLTIRRHNDWEKVRRPEMMKLAKKRINRRELVQGKWNGAMLHMSMRRSLQRRHMHLNESMLSGSENVVPSLKLKAPLHSHRTRTRSGVH